MVKVCIWFGGAAIALFIGYATVADVTEGSPWYLVTIWIAFVVAGVLFLLTGLVYLFLLGKKRRNPIDILDDWRCMYWPSEKKLKVTLWVHDYSGTTTFSVTCIAHFSQQVVNVNDDVTIGGTYMAKDSLKSGQHQPMMVECFKSNVELFDASTSTVCIRIKPFGMWAAKKKSKVLSVQVINQ